MAKSRSKSQQGLYSAYKSSNKQATNRKRKLLKLQKQFPNNLQLTEALKNIKYRRYTPKTPHWSHSSIQKVMLFKEFKKAGKVVHPMQEKEMFKLRTRAHFKGDLVWNHS